MGARLFDSVEEETAVPVDAKVIGNIPRWLKGSLLRNGPGKYEAGVEPVGHIFDGFAYMHKFIIFPGGKVQYQGKFLRSDVYKAAIKHQRLTFGGFGTVARHPDPCKTLFQRVTSMFKVEITDNCNVAFVKFGDDFFVATETIKFRKIDPETLDTQEMVPITKYVSVHTTTAHPHYGRDGTTYNMGTRMGLWPQYSIVKVPPCQNGENPWLGASILSSIPTSSFNPGYYHSFGMTENYIVFLEQPTQVNVLKAFLKNFTGVAFTDCMLHNVEQPMRFHLIRRDTGEVIKTKYTADGFFIFHHINAYEKNNQVVVDVCAFDDLKILSATTLEKVREGGLPEHNAVARRFVLPLDVDKPGRDGNLVNIPNCRASAILRDDGSVFLAPFDLCDVTIETPVVNYEDYNGREYRYFYGMGGNLMPIYKVDNETGKVWTWEEEYCFPSEPIFVGAPTKLAEDDGVILSLVVNVVDEKKPAFLLVLDAKDFTELARAEVPAGVKVPRFTIHGMFVDGLLMK